MIRRSTLRKLHRKMPIKEAVQYSVRQKADAFATAVEVKSAEWRPTSLDERRFMEVKATVETRTWFLWSEKLGAIVPKIGDKLTAADGSVWLVALIGNELGGARWRLSCTKGRAA